MRLVYSIGAALFRGPTRSANARKDVWIFSNECVVRNIVVAIRYKVKSSLLFSINKLQKEDIVEQLLKLLSVKDDSNFASTLSYTTATFRILPHARMITSTFAKIFALLTIIEFGIFIFLITLSWMKFLAYERCQFAWGQGGAILRCNFGVKIIALFYILV